MVKALLDTFQAPLQGKSLPLGQGLPCGKPPHVVKLTMW
jgi:hypothetical protein